MDDKINKGLNLQDVILDAKERGAVIGYRGNIVAYPTQQDPVYVYYFFNQEGDEVSHWMPDFSDHEELSYGLTVFEKDAPRKWHPKYKDLLTRHADLINI